MVKIQQDPRRINCKVDLTPKEEQGVKEYIRYMRRQLMYATLEMAAVSVFLTFLVFYDPDLLAGFSSRQRLCTYLAILLFWGYTLWVLRKWILSIAWRMNRAYRSTAHAKSRFSSMVQKSKVSFGKGKRDNYVLVPVEGHLMEGICTRKAYEEITPGTQVVIIHVPDCGFGVVVS